MGKWYKLLTGNFTREAVQTANKHMERCSTSKVIKKKEKENHYTPTRIAKILKD